MLTDTTRSPFARFTSVSTGAVRWTEGFWKDQFERCRTTSIPTMWRIWDDAEVSHGFENFEIAAGRKPGAHQGPPWHDGDLYKWLEAAASTLAIHADPDLDAHLDEIIAVIADAQLPNGYLHTPTVIAQRGATSNAAAFEERLHFETYNMGHLMTAACVHFRATGKTTLLDVARRAADYLEEFYRTSASALARNAICPSHYMGVIELYRTTGEPRYLELGRNLVEIRDLVDGHDDNQDRLPFRRQTAAVGHAVRANYLYAGVADVYAETGDPTLLETLQALWRNVTSQKMYVTGGCGALYDGASPDGDPDEDAISVVHQAYGRDYQLPNVTAYNETCANIGNVLWNWRMLAATGDARHADVLELALYNSVLSGIGLDGETYCYTNALRQVNGLSSELRVPGGTWQSPPPPTPPSGERLRERYISCFCCPPNVLRTIAQVQDYAYSTSDDTLWVNLYGTNELDEALDGSRIRLRQRTDYPWDGQITITIDEAPSKDFALRLRIPAWTHDATVHVNGEPHEAPRSSGYATVRRVWLPGDTVVLQLPMPVRLLEANPLVEETRNQVAVARGPVVYCLETSDLPSGIRPSEVILERSAHFRPHHGVKITPAAEPVTALEARVRLRPDEVEQRDELYREVPGGDLREAHVSLIPYFAWGNRGPSEMTVWIPLAW